MPLWFMQKILSVRTWGHIKDVSHTAINFWVKISHAFPFTDALIIPQLSWLLIGRFRDFNTLHVSNELWIWEASFGSLRYAWDRRKKGYYRRVHLA